MGILSVFTKYIHCDSEIHSFSQLQCKSLPVKATHANRFTALQAKQWKAACGWFAWAECDHSPSPPRYCLPLRILSRTAAVNAHKNFKVSMNKKIAQTIKQCGTSRWWQRRRIRQAERALQGNSEGNRGGVIIIACQGNKHWYLIPCSGKTLR